MMDCLCRVCLIVVTFEDADTLESWLYYLNTVIFYRESTAHTPLLPDSSFSI